jgi:hypothetical protein
MRLSRLRGRVEEDRHRSHSHLAAEPLGPHDLPRPDHPAPTHPHHPLLDRDCQRRPRLFRLLPERGGAIPWRTLTGRQHLYLDHEAYIAFGEHLPTYKPRPRPPSYDDLTIRPGLDRKLLNYLTPHGKWHIHSTYGDTLRMKTLSRGSSRCGSTTEDAGLGIGIVDNDWVEVTTTTASSHTRLRQRAHPFGNLLHLPRARAHRGRAQVPLRGNAARAATTASRASASSRSS